MIVVTGATGQLGRLVVGELLQRLPAAQIIAAVRHPEKAADLAALGVQVRHADYDQPATLDRALVGASKVLLISANEFGKRTAQHRRVIEAAARARVSLLAYTSILHQPTSPISLAGEHGQTEAILHATGLPYVVLRNGWYLENYLGVVAPALAHGVVLGAAGSGRISAAARADYAAAAAIVLTQDQHAGSVYELAGDHSFTMTEFATTLARLSGKPVRYQDLTQAAYRAELVKLGLPEGVAGVLANADAGIAQGALHDDRRQLSQLLGRATTSLESVLRQSLG